MGVLDKFLDVMKINDDDYDDYENEDFFDDEEYIEEKPKKTSILKNKESRRSAAESKPKYSKSSASYGDEKPVKSVSTSSMRQNKSVGNMEVRVMRPTTYDGAKDIAESLLDGRTVLLNLEGLDIDIAQRIIDFVSGAIFAIDGSFEKVANYIFVIAPSDVGISGDMSGMISSHFGSPSVGNSY